MKKNKILISCVSLLLSITLLISSIVLVQASDEDEYEQGPTIDEMMEDIVYMEERSQFLFDFFEMDMAEIEKNQELFERLISNGNVYIDDENHLIFEETFSGSIDEEAFIRMDVIRISLNKLIDEEVIIFEPMAYTRSVQANDNQFTIGGIQYRVTVMPFSELAQKDENALNTILSANNDLANLFNRPQEEEITISGRSINGEINFAGRVNNNKIRIRDLFSLYLSMMEPTAAFTMLVIDWVTLVRNNGEWDYKTKEGYNKGEQYLCYLGPKNDYYTQIMTGENMGNYNYGYTGWMLFPQVVLIAGSVAVSNFNIKKDRHDWPDIKQGYRDSGIVGYK